MPQMLETVHFDDLDKIVLKVQVTCVGGDAIRDFPESSACAYDLAKLVAAGTHRGTCLGPY